MDNMDSKNISRKTWCCTCLTLSIPFLIWGSQWCGDTGLISMVLLTLGLGLGLWFRDPHTLPFQRHWGCKRHDKENTALDTHYCFHTFRIWASHECGNVSVISMTSFRLGVGFRDLQSLQLQGHWRCKRLVKENTALHQYYSFHTFLIWASQWCW